MKKFLLNAFLLLGLSFADWYDQGDGWVITGGNVASSTLGSYEGSMSLTAVVLDADGNNLAEVSSISGDNYSGDLLGVFDPSGGLRGVVHTTAPPFGTYAGQAQFLCLIGGVAGDNGSAFTLKLYDASSDSVIDIDQTVTFSVNDIQGSAPAPIVLTGSAGAADGGGTDGGSDDSSWYSQGNGWVITGGNVASATLGSYEGSMSLTAVVLDDDGNNLAELSNISGDSYTGDLLGVFDPTGGLRGVVHTTAPPFGTYAGQPQFLCLIGGVADDNGSAFTLKLYDASSGSVIDINETVTFSVNDIQGSAPAPIVLTGSAGAADGGDTGGTGGDDGSAGYVDTSGWTDQNNGWVITGGNVASATLGSFEGSMSLTSVIIDSNGNNVAEVSNVSGDSYTGDLLGVFDPTGGLRGVVHTTAPPFGAYAGQAQFLCLIGGVADDNGSAFTLKFYDASSGLTYDLDQTVTFNVNDIQGSAPAPIVYNLDLGSTPTVNGCTNPLACNYNASANSDDGSCTYAADYYDCNDVCLLDADSDGVCDQLEVGGCTDSNACNYNDLATDDDNSCVYATNYYVDADGDGLGTGDATAYCPADVPSSGVSLNDSDADDACFSNTYQDWYVDSDGDGLGFGNATNICTDTTSVDGSVLNNSDLDDDCFSNTYQDWYVDSDGDGLGFGDATTLCTDTTSVDGSVTNNDDTEPDCATNDTDACGVCAGSNACAGCVDPNASNTNLEYLVNDTALDCSAESYTDLDDADLSCCVYTSFSFNQSMRQSAYFFSDVKIDGVSAEVGVDEIYAFNGDVCVGGGTWNGPTIEIMLMGDDEQQFTAGYLQDGDVPTFKIIDASSGLQYEAVFNGVSGQFGDCASEGYPGNLISSLDDNGVTMSTATCQTFPAFVNYNAHWDLGTAEAVKDCNGVLGGNAYIDDCSDCVFSDGHNANDPDDDTVCNAGAVNGETDNCPDTANTDQANNDSDSEGDACDVDDDNDTVADGDDLDPFESSVCVDSDVDGCDDCSQTMSGPDGANAGPDTSNDGLDTDSDGACNVGDTDDDNDTVLDDVDLDSLNPSVCSDLDGDGCDDCSQTASDNFDANDVNPQVDNDGLDTDSDGACNVGDEDDDNDTVLDGVDLDSLNPSVCSDTDNDGCDDCSQTASDNFDATDVNPQVDNDGDDNDSDGACDLGDDDDDNDSVSDSNDTDPFDPSVCQDLDSDTCDDCSGTNASDFSGTYPDTLNDGDDNDSDGACDAGDNDDDNDTVLDTVDANKNESSVCEDSDGDGCDDCSQVMSGSDGQNIGPDTDNDGADNDEDGACDVGDADDDNDGVDDGDDSDPFESSECQDLDGDTCDDCSQSMSGPDGNNYGPTPNDDGDDNDSDGLCDDGDTDDDNDTVLDGDDNDPFDPSACEDSDNDTCDDCSANSSTDFSGVTPDTSNDGADNDSDGACDDGDDDDDNDTVDDDFDNAPFDASSCEDSDNDTCDDCSQTMSGVDGGNVGPDTSNDGPDNDLGWNTGFGETLCDAGDDDDDNDGVYDDSDSDSFDPYLCSDTDADQCEDCQSGAYDPYNDGVDYDTDGLCDAGDDDDDGDNVSDDVDDCDPDNEGINDSDFGEDSSSLGWTSSAVTDHDSDGCKDADEDLDDDNDGMSDSLDECDPDADDSGVEFSDLDWDSSNSALDYDQDGCLDTSDEDNDDDNDGIADISDDCDPDNGLASDLGWTSISSNVSLGTDHDQDGCQDSGEDQDDDNDLQGDSSDDCDPDNGIISQVGWDSNATNPDSDYDDDGCQDSDVEDLDDDNDGVADADDSCATGELGWTSNDVTDFDGDGCLDASTEDVDDDNDGACDDQVSDFEPGYTGDPCFVVTGGDSDDNNPNVCADEDLDGCEDCLSGSFDPNADGADDDSDGHCNLGDVDVALNLGANSVSFFALPSSGDYGVSNIFGSAGSTNSISKVFGEGTIAFNLEDLGNWVGSLQDVSDDDGYWVISDAISSLEVQGYPTYVAGVEYTLHEGNNFVSYPYFNGQSLDAGLAGTPALDNLAYIYGEGTSALLLPTGAWVGSLNNTGLAGGKGYWFGANAPFTFSYNEPNLLGRFVNRELPQVPAELAYKQSTEQYFYFIQEAQVDNMDLSHGDWIVAYNNDVVVGARQYDANAIMVDVPIMGSFAGSELRSSVLNLTAGYCEPGDIPSIKVHRTNGEIVDMFVTAVEGSLGFQGMGHAIVTLSDVNFPQEVSLHNAYPNPFNPSTMIQYDLPQGSMHVNLSVFDIRGRLVAELVNEIQSGSSDSYNVMWNADTHSSGMYFVQLRAGNTVKNQKIMLLK